jgi:hypothetical protein
MKSHDWEGTVVKKSRGLLDGSNLYRRLRVRLTDGRIVTVRVGRKLWDEVVVGDTVTNVAGQAAIKR